MTLLICEISVANTTMPRTMVMSAIEVSAWLSGDDEPVGGMGVVQGRFEGVHVFHTRVHGTRAKRTN